MVWSFIAFFNTLFIFFFFIKIEISRHNVGLKEQKYNCLS